MSSTTQDDFAVSTPGRRAAWAALAATFALSIVITQVTGYELHDADSRLYAGMSADLGARPVHQWLAPEWQGRWGRDGLFREHPPGMLWLGAPLVRLGASGYVAVYAVNFACLMLELLLLYAIGTARGGPLVGAAATFAWAANPSFVQYLVRGNHEHPMALAAVLTLYALLVARSGRGRLVLWAAALALAVWVKGISGLALLPIAGAYWLIYERRAQLLLVLLGGALAVFATLALFELAYVNLTGESFWRAYVVNQVQLSVGAGSGSTELASGSAGFLVTLAHKARNLFYYFARPLWFFFPWVFLVLFGLVETARRRAGAPRLREAVWGMGLVAAAVFVFGFSLADRKADRYIFPCYPALALASGWLLVRYREAPWARGLVAVLERRRAVLPFVLSLALLVGVAVKVYVGTYHYQFIRVWSGAEDHRAP